MPLCFSAAPAILRINVATLGNITRARRDEPCRTDEARHFIAGDGLWINPTVQEENKKDTGK